MKLPRFTLRDLFWLVLVAALGCAWWVERTKRTASDRDRLIWQDNTFELQSVLRNRGVNVNIEGDGSMSADTWGDGS